MTTIVKTALKSYYLMRLKISLNGALSKNLNNEKSFSQVFSTLSSAMTRTVERMPQMIKASIHPSAIKSMFVSEGHSI